MNFFGKKLSFSKSQQSSPMSSSSPSTSSPFPFSSSSSSSSTSTATPLGYPSAAVMEEAKMKNTCQLRFFFSCGCQLWKPYIGSVCNQRHHIHRTRELTTTCGREECIRAFAGAQHRGGNMDDEGSAGGGGGGGKRVKLG